MVESRVCKFYATAVGYSCCRTPLPHEQRRSLSVSLHLQRHNHFQYGSLTHIVQRTSACKLRSICNSLRLGAAEEGESSWQDKLDSTSTKKGELLEGEPEIAQSDHIVDEEGNIDNIEQEQSRSPNGEDKAGSLDQSQHPPHSEAAGRFTPTSSNLWPGEDGIKEGDKGEANVGSVRIDPSHSQQAEVSPAEFQEREKYGSSESTCDEGSLSKRNSPQGYGGGIAMQKNRLQEEGPEEEVFRLDDGRTPDDYQRRADLFGKSGEESVAQKHKNESIRGLIETQFVGFIKRVPFWG